MSHVRRHVPSDWKSDGGIDCSLSLANDQLLAGRRWTRRGDRATAGSSQPAANSIQRTAVLVAIGLMLLAAPLRSQPCGASAVVSVARGDGGGFGFEYLPENVLGFPDTAARAAIPTVDPQQVVGIGLGGEIVLKFDRAIVDGPGPDFTVFENAFIYRLGAVDRTYSEPAEVSVSRDGITFAPFPFDSLTLEGCAGTTPTYGDHDPGDPAVSGGNSFDLGAIGVDSIRFVRLRDVTSVILSNPKHPFRDPTLNGFDLDAVVAVHSVSAATGRAPSDAGATRSITLIDNRVVVDAPDASSITLRLFSIDGRELWSARLEPGRSSLPLSSIINGRGFFLMVATIDGQTKATRVAR